MVSFFYGSFDIAWRVVASRGREGLGKCNDFLHDQTLLNETLTYMPWPKYPLPTTKLPPDGLLQFTE